MPRLCNPVLLTHDLTQSFRAHTFSLREDPWPNFSFRVAYAHRIFDDATQCKSCFRIASTSACLELSSATASATFRYAGFSLRKRNSITSPLCNFIMGVFDAAQVTPPSSHLLRFFSPNYPTPHKHKRLRNHPPGHMDKAVKTHPKDADQLNRAMGLGQ